jgi:hypothetical protein
VVERQGVSGATSGVEDRILAAGRDFDQGARDRPVISLPYGPFATVRLLATVGRAARGMFPLGDAVIAPAIDAVRARGIVDIGALWGETVVVAVRVVGAFERYAPLVPAAEQYSVTFNGGGHLKRVDG